MPLRAFKEKTIFLKAVKLLSLGIMATLLMSFSSCAKKSAKVSTGISVISSMSIGDSAGGTLVAGQHTNGWSFSHYFPPGEEVIVEMELGIWNLAVITYSGSSMGTGVSECASGEYRVSDSGEDVNIKVSAANCAKAGVKNIRMRACSVGSFTSSETNPSLLCVPSGATSGGDSLGMRSYKVAYLSQENLTQVKEAPSYSSCITEDNLEDGDIKLFTGDHSVIKQVPLSFYFFPSTDCSGNGKVFRTRPNLVDESRTELFKSSNLYSTLNTKIIYINADSEALGIPEPENNAPVVLSAINHFLKKRGSVINLTASDHFQDLEYDTMTYSCYFDKVIDDTVNVLTETPCDSMSYSDGSMSFNSSTGEFNWAIGSNAADSYEFKIVADDGDLSSSVQFLVNTMDLISDKNPNTNGLEVWLEPKEAYLYTDAKATEHASQGDDVVAWRNKVPKGSNKALLATTLHGNGPTFQNESALSATAEHEAYTPHFNTLPTLSFNASANTALALHGGSYDEGNEMTYIIYFTRNTKTVNDLNNILSKANSDIPGISFEVRLTTNQNPEALHSTLVGGQSLEASSYPVENSRVCLAYTIDLVDQKSKMYLGTQSLSTQFIDALSGLNFNKSSEPLIIGNKLIKDGTKGHNGNIAELLIWSKKLSETEIQTECERLEGLYYIL